MSTSTTHKGHPKNHSRIAEDAVVATGITDFLDQARDTLSSTAENVTEQLSDALEVGQSMAEHAIHSAKKSLRSNVKSVRATAKKYPLETVLVGVGVGCAIGWLLKSRN